MNELQDTRKPMSEEAEALFRMAIDPLRRQACIEEAAFNVACVFWIDHGQSLPVWKDLPETVKNRYRVFVEFLLRSLDPLVVTAAIEATEAEMVDWMHGPGNPKDEEQFAKDFTREALLRFRAQMLEPEVRA